MTKLSDRMPDTNYVAGMGEWLKELALCFEALDQREQKESRYVRKELTRIWQNSGYIQKGIPEYEPQTYDEAIALIKGWRRCVDGTGRVQWITPDGVRMEESYSIKDQCVGGFISWEKDKWPELWKEMTEAKHGANLCFYENEWVLNVQSLVHRDSTPGRVVCQAYLVFKGHADWAERLSKND